MTQLTIQDEPVNHTAADRCLMTFSTQGAAAELHLEPKAGPGAMGGAGPSFLDELRSQGFKPVGDAFRMTPGPQVARARPSAMNVAIDQPKGHYLICVVTQGPGDEARWFLPEPEVLVAHSAHASAFSRSGGGPGAMSTRPTVRALFRIPASPAPKRTGPGPQSVFKRIVRFFKVKIQKAIFALKNQKKKLADKLARFVDKKILKAREGLKIVRPNMKLPRASEKQLAAMEDKEVLLLVHGIFSSIRVAFGTAAVGSKPPITTLVKRYDKRVLGFDHWTVSKTTLENARDLADALPKGAKLKIVCHSRGGGVVRCLLEHPSVVKKMKSKGITVSTVVFVAGACLGSSLAHPGSVDRLINGASRLLVLAGLSSLPVKAVAYLFKLLLHGVQKLPGIDAMSPSSAIFDELKKAKKTMAARYVYFRANYDPRKLPARIGDEILVDQVVFRGAGNDVIVPYAGAGITKAYLSAGQVTKTVGKSYGTAKKPQTVVWHTNFFVQKDVRAGLLKFASP